MIFQFVQNPFIKAKDRVDTKNLSHSHIEYSKKPPMKKIGCLKDYIFRILLTIYLENMRILLFILFKNDSKSVDC